MIEKVFNFLLLMLFFIASPAMAFINVDVDTSNLATSNEILQNTPDNLGIRVTTSRLNLNAKYQSFLFLQQQDKSSSLLTLFGGETNIFDDYYDDGKNFTIAITSDNNVIASCTVQLQADPAHKENYENLIQVFGMVYSGNSASLRCRLLAGPARPSVI